MNKKPGYEELERRIRELEEEIVVCKEAVVAAKDERRQFVSIFDTIDEMVYVADPETYELLYVNAPVKNVFGQDIIGKKCYEVLQGLNSPCDFCTNPIIFNENFGETHIWEFQNRENKRWYRCIDKAIPWPDGRMVRYEIAIDIHDRIEAEEALKESEKRFSTFMDHLPGSAFMKNEKSQYIYVNKFMGDTFGAKEWLNRPMHELFPEELAKEFIAGDIKTLKQGAQIITNSLPTKDGVNRTYRTYKFPILREGKPPIVGGMGVEITEQVKAEEALKESEENYRTLVESSSDAIVMLNTERKIVSCNQAFLDLFGYEINEIEGRLIRIIHQSDESFRSFGEKAYPVIKRVGSYRTEWEFMHKDGSTIPVETITSSIKSSYGSIRGYVAIMRDNTERKQIEEEKKRLEDQLQKAQKMEAIGTLAGGIAHDFNNVLYPIFGYTEMTMDEVAEKSIARKNLEGVLKAAKRARDLVQQILTFSRQSEQERRPIKIQPVIKEALKLLRSSLPTTIKINQYLDRECGAIMADSTQIHQIVMNLCTNAYHAMREKGGVLEVGIRNVEFGMGSVDKKDKEERSSIEYPVLKTGKYLELTVSDTGHGMSRDVMSRIFDPYFTTKAPGDGTGMGLAVTYGIAKSHGGDIRVYSKEGEGTTFHVYMPVVERDVVKPKAEHTDIIQRGDEHILLVDDEQQLVQMIQQMLERSGYHVTPRTSSVEALEAFRAQSGKFDLVITDMTMPNMTGSELAASLLEIRPDIPIILCTGFSEVVSEEKAKEIGIREYVMKPIIWSEITSAIRRVLDT